MVFSDFLRNCQFKDNRQAIILSCLSDIFSLNSIPISPHTDITTEPVAKRFSLVKVKADKNFNRRRHEVSALVNTLSILRIKI